MLQLELAAPLRVSALVLSSWLHFHMAACNKSFSSYFNRKQKVANCISVQRGGGSWYINIHFKKKTICVLAIYSIYRNHCSRNIKGQKSRFCLQKWYICIAQTAAMVIHFLGISLITQHFSVWPSVDIVLCTDLCISFPNLKIFSYLESPPFFIMVNIYKRWGCTFSFSSLSSVSLLSFCLSSFLSTFSLLGLQKGCLCSSVSIFISCHILTFTLAFLVPSVLGLCWVKGKAFHTEGVARTSFGGWVGVYLILPLLQCIPEIQNLGERWWFGFEIMSFTPGQERNVRPYNRYNEKMPNNTNHQGNTIQNHKSEWLIQQDKK